MERITSRQNPLITRLRRLGAEKELIFDETEKTLC